MLGDGGHGRGAIPEDPEKPELGHREVVLGRRPGEHVLYGEADLHQGVDKGRSRPSVEFRRHFAIVVS